VPCAYVVDDTGDIRFLMKLLLAHCGLEVLEAPTGAAFLDELAAGARPDVVVLDLQMPELDGWDTLQRIREQRDLDAVAVVICSVKAGPDDQRRAWELGCDGYISKPFANGAFVDEITTVLARSPDERRALRVRQIVGAS